MKIKTISDTYFPQHQLKALKPLLERWMETIEGYSSKLANLGYEDPDACYWYNERANVSILSASAWLTSGWFGLEEFSTRKQDGLGGDKHGRCDLIVYGAKDAYAFEAKQAWQAIGERSAMSNIAPMLKAAFRDVGALDKLEADRRIAACFIVPSFSNKDVEKRGEGWINSRLEWFIQELKQKSMKERGWSGAWVFPGVTRTLQSSSRTYPGIALLLKERKRANHQRTTHRVQKP